MTNPVFETGVLSEEDVSELLSRRLVGHRWPGASIASMRVDRQRFTPGKEMTTAVSLELTGGGAPSARQQAVVTFVPRRTLNRIAKNMRWEDSGLIFDEDEGFLIELFPSDWRLPALPLALDPVKLAERLESYMARDAYEKLEVRLLRYRPHTRALMSIVFRDAAGAAIVDGMGKIFATAGGAEDSWRALAALAEQSGDLPVAPLPLCYDPDWRFVMMEKVAGKPMQPILAHALDEDGSEAIRMTASALHRFHGMTVEFEVDDDEEAETRLLADELFEVRDQARKFAEIAGWLSEEAYDVCDRIEALSASLPEAPLRLVHGSFKGEQVIVGADHAVIVDLDGIGMGDPAVDIGNFVAKQFKDARQDGWAHLDDYGQQLLHDYVALSDDPMMLARCRLFESISLARLAFRELHTARRDLAEAREASPSGRLIAQALVRLQEAEQA